MSSARLAALLGLAAVVLAGCAGQARRAEAPDLASQRAREAALASEDDWGLVGRIAFFDGDDNGSGRLEWRQAGDRYEILIAAPVSRQSWRLRGDAGDVVLEGMEGGPRRARSADQLLAEATGWRIPLSQLEAWARGLRASDRGELRIDASGLPRQIIEDGWTVEYRDWHSGHEPPLPRRVFAQRGDTRVRLVVERWLPPAELGQLAVD